MRRNMVALGVVLVLVFAAGLVPAREGQTAGAKPGPVGSQAPSSGPRPTCNGPEYHQFDFWVGDWNVTSGGQMAGMNLVTLDVVGCVHEDPLRHRALVFSQRP